MTAIFQFYSILHSAIPCNDIIACLFSQHTSHCHPLQWYHCLFIFTAYFTLPSLAMISLLVCFYSILHTLDKMETKTSYQETLIGQSRRNSVKNIDRRHNKWSTRTFLSIRPIFRSKLFDKFQVTINFASLSLHFCGLCPSLHYLNPKFEQKYSQKCNFVQHNSR